MSKTAEDLWSEINKGAVKDTESMSQDDQDKKANRELKKKYAHWFIYILIVQLVVMNCVFIAQGLGCLKFDEVTLRFYTTSTLIEVLGVIVIIVRNLFPSQKSIN